MFAIIKTGGKQYKVSKGDKIWVEKLEGQAGDTISISEVLMLNDGNDVKVGVPLIDKALVEFKIVEQTRDDKVIIFKKRRRQNSRRKNGHRQHKTILMVNDISLAGKSTVSAKTDSAVKEKKAPASDSSAKEAAPKKTKPSSTAAKAPAQKKPAASKTIDKK